MKLHRERHGLLLATTLLTLTVPSKGDPTAAELVRKASDNLASTTALQFSFTARAMAPGFGLSSLSAGKGSVIWPDQLVFSGSMQNTPVLAVPVTMVACNTKTYVELGDGKFQQMQGIPDVKQLLFAPDSGLTNAVLKKLENLSTPHLEKLDTVPTWRISGTIPTKSLSMLSGPGTAASSTTIRTELWIGQKDLRLRQVTLTGPIFGGDSAQTIRTLAFSHFNERTPLAVPRGHSPCGQP